jgi:hypothetical protein
MGILPPEEDLSARAVFAVRKVSRVFVCCAASWLLCSAVLSRSSSNAPQKDARTIWKPVAFAIVRYNDDAPKSWNLYHSDKKGVLLLRLWKRYLLVNVSEQEVYDIDPQKVKLNGDSAETAEADIPDEPVKTTEWKERDAGPVQRIRFRFGEKGNFLEIQIPMKPDGKPAY